MNRLVNFDCVKCAQNLHIQEEQCGNLIHCPHCSTEMTVSMSSNDTVPVNIGLKNWGSIQTNVSKQDAGRLASTWLGGLLVALGVLLCSFILGVRPPKQG